MNKVLIILAILASIMGGFFIMKNMNNTEIRYVAVGDSYTEGTGNSTTENYPKLLTQKLSNEGKKIKLVANLGVGGYMTFDAIEEELPRYEALQPTFATLLIGANDLVQEIDEQTFRKNLSILLDRMQAKLTKKDNFIVLTIPDFSVTPMAKSYDRLNISNEIARFNEIIKDEAGKRNLKVVNIFELTQEMGRDASLIDDDGLHPSDKEYERWVNKIAPVALELL